MHSSASDSAPLLSCDESAYCVSPPLQYLFPKYKTATMLYSFIPPSPLKQDQVLMCEPGLDMIFRSSSFKQQIKLDFDNDVLMHSPSVHSSGISNYSN